MLQTPAILFCDIDGLLPLRGKMAPGFDDFIAGLEHAAIPNVWVTTRTRLLIDDPRRKLGHSHPFIAEGGCGVYLPEGYFHLRPPKTVRLGRFTCLPIAEPQPAAAEALEELAAETGVSVVPLRSLSPRELAQNSGLPPAQAELMRQPDFDEVFFFGRVGFLGVFRLLSPLPPGRSLVGEFKISIMMRRAMPCCDPTVILSRYCFTLGVVTSAWSLRARAAVVR